MECLFSIEKFCKIPYASQSSLIRLKERSDVLKKLGVFFIGILGILLVMFAGRSFLNQETKAVETTGGQAQTLTIFNWGEYIDPALIKQFEKESGYKVIYSTFDSNEAMETKIKQGGTHYDLVFPSESIIPKMLENNLLLPLDHQKIQGMENLSPFLLNQAFDPGNQYSLPYFWGTLGIMVNTDLVAEDSIQRWDDL